jgi:hydroxymethylbilane synthase
LEESSVLQAPVAKGRTYRIATRRSAMALVQTRRIIALLDAEAQRTGSGDTFVLHEVVSDGCFERFQGNLRELGGKGAFVKALECELVAGNADLAMHSLKDVPGDAEMLPELCLPCMLPREDLRDAVVTRVGETFVGLKAGATIGTNSVRRAAQLRAGFPHLNVVPLRGNADTRVQRVDDGTVDAAMLALAGLRRIGLEHRVSSVLEPDVLMPAVGQGVVTVQCRQDDAAAQALLAKINHADTLTCVTAERAMLAALAGDCHSSIGGYCEVTKGGNLRLLGMVSSLDGQTVLHARGKETYGNPVALGQAVAADLLAQGAEQLLRP